jgi:hypothetical protein
MQKLDKNLTAKIYDFLRMNFEEVYQDGDSEGTCKEFFIKRNAESQGHDMLSVYTDCDGKLTVSADCWDDKNNVLLENAINWLITA